LSYLPSFGCGARDEQISDDDDGKESSQEEYEEGEVPGKERVAKEVGQQEKESNCQLF
jgi:hypothetical protein